MVSVMVRPRFLASRSALTRLTVAVVTCSRMPCGSRHAKRGRHHSRHMHPHTAQRSCLESSLFRLTG